MMVIFTKTIETFNVNSNIRPRTFQFFNKIKESNEKNVTELNDPFSFEK